MDAKTEAKRIFNLFFLSSLKVSQKQAKEFSLILVEEILKTEPMKPSDWVNENEQNEALIFWEQVETEIKLINENNK